MNYLETQQRITDLLSMLTILYERQTDLYRSWKPDYPKPEALTLVQQEIADLETEYDRLKS